MLMSDRRNISEDKPLTKKQQAFIEEYSRCFNGTQSAIAVGYSPQSARHTAYKLLQQPNVKKALAENLEQIKDERIVSATELLVHMSNILRGEDEEEMIFLNPKSGEVVKGSRRVTPKDRLKAGEMLGKYHGILKERHEIEKTTFVVDIEGIDEVILNERLTD
ncbi:terminase small subunit [Bacillus manliponensis]|uniref:terminase small subunit n=1 Tax=Bacillus manliponensis TaxID=574376 RepID=UPI0035162412